MYRIIHIYNFIKLGLTRENKVLGRKVMQYK